MSGMVGNPVHVGDFHFPETQCIDWDPLDVFQWLVESPNRLSDMHACKFLDSDISGEMLLQDVDMFLLTQDFLIPQNHAERVIKNLEILKQSYDVQKREKLLAEEQKKKQCGGGVLPANNVQNFGGQILPENARFELEFATDSELSRDLQSDSEDFLIDMNTFLFQSGSYPDLSSDTNAGNTDDVNTDIDQVCTDVKQDSDKIQDDHERMSDKTNIDDEREWEPEQGGLDQPDPDLGLRKGERIYKQKLPDLILDQEEDINQRPIKKLQLGRKHPGKNNPHQANAQRFAEHGQQFGVDFRTYRSEGWGDDDELLARQYVHGLKSANDANFQQDLDDFAANADRHEKNAFAMEMLQGNAFAMEMLQGLYGANLDLDNMNTDQIMALQEQLGGDVKVGVSNVETFPITKIQTSERAETLEPCSICIEPYCIHDSIRTLPCLHIYHSSCIDSWLLNHHTCPVCKYDLNAN